MNETLERKYRLKFSDFNCHDVIAPYAVLDYFQDVAGEHADYIGVGFNDMVSKGYFWVLVRTRFDVVSSLKEYSNIIVKTWPKKRGKIDFDREYEILDENGNLMIKGISKWCVIDMNTRRLTPCRDLNYTCGIYDKENYPEPFKKIEDFSIDGYNVYEGKVDYIDIDHNGHVNNIAYARFISNAVKFEKNEKIKVFEIDYIKELKKDDEFIMFYEKMNNIIKVKGFNKLNNELSFASVIELE